MPSVHSSNYGKMHLDLCSPITQIYLYNRCKRIGQDHCILLLKNVHFFKKSLATS